MLSSDSTQCALAVMRSVWRLLDAPACLQHRRTVRVHAQDSSGARVPDQDAISVIETDCEVDFAPPLDYVEPKRPDPAAAAAAAAASASAQRTADGAGAHSVTC